MKPPISLRAPGRTITVNETVRRLNPAVFSVGADPSPQREHDQGDALVRRKPPQRRSKGRVEVVATIIRCGPRCLDDDNAISGGTKALRDAIAKDLGYDDGDKRIRFQYAQSETAGEPGCIVKIEMV